MEPEKKNRKPTNKATAAADFIMVKNPMEKNYVKMVRRKSPPPPPSQTAPEPSSSWGFERYVFQVLMILFVIWFCLFVLCCQDPEGVPCYDVVWCFWPKGIPPRWATLNFFGVI
jgi:hypothetical protein